jgi:hypothetical protein
MLRPRIIQTIAQARRDCLNTHIREGERSREAWNFIKGLAGTLALPSTRVLRQSQDDCIPRRHSNCSLPGTSAAR